MYNMTCEFVCNYKFKAVTGLTKFEVKIEFLAID